ncbi:fumarylacetoacetate hydrolase family protein [Chelatococcus daeguensis]|uniref:fumarylacetoacetate hydrolase family protein n=1 Tax=Chelatococcus daeguensis TaxID=444444 RepID=UPI0007AB7FC7|nr:fumarylacetoacetate hydrolase family protein [Chelatococcus daeguensis]KZE27466.1 fumarylacetoacetate hydrolase [Chelatococcus daeguensis]MBM3085684.1 fumarylacetoacetate hydrolase family protein [Chelatococcus daeguensis]
MKTLFALPPTPVIPVVGREAGFPVRRVFCVGRNYAEHAREMGRDPDREPPFFFTKWAETVMPGGGEITYPRQTKNYHFELEMVVAIDGAGQDLDEEAAARIVFGYAVGLDMTRRDLQAAAKDLARPWDFAKNVEQSAPVGAITPAAEMDPFERAAMELKVNGATRQRGDIADMIWPVAPMLSILSRFYRLEPGDLVMTGTPAGVGAVVPGDVIEATIAGLTPLTVTITQPSSPDGA